MTSARVPGGLLRVLVALAGAQSARHVVTVLSPLRPADLAHEVGWQPIALDGNARLLQHRELLRRVRTLRPDVIVLHAGSPGECALAAALLARRVPTVLIEHAPDVYPLHRPWRTRVFGRLKRRATRWASVSEAGARQLERLFELPPGTVETLHPGVGAPDAAPATAGSLVLGLGRPDPAKGFDVFCSVAESLHARFPASRWLWMGADRSDTIGCVELVPWGDAGSALASADLVLIPSRAEGLPLVLLEAFALGRAVVASRVGGIPEAAEDGVHALLVEPGDAAAPAAAVAALLEDPRRRAALGAAAREQWRRRFTADAMAARFERLVAPLVAGAFR